MSLQVVLFQPEIPQNTGNIARTCACMGVENLHVVHPLGFQLTPRNIRRSGMDYLEQVEIVQWASNDAFLEEHGNDTLWMFTGQSERLLDEVDLWKAGAGGSTGGGATVSDGADSAKLGDSNGSPNSADPDLFLCFGRESAGIDEDILARYESSCVRIPMKDGMRSLNLANAVAIGVYEAMRQRRFSGLI
jgi:tRNA (cytidine/uridine-2'-O-)-methyltransferase